ncbi:sensor histidine kinase [Chryseolinea lacunae]|uniref:histidine kinase n=1 Tax=Chryseolinea lacunae TaxID=2801331 RepID=A0ABS1KK05_9BACT|nr:HAMP domain-containing sensor histidine kinase [Chryseolinea lacunae]MBL0739796.1 HAMP domain-containing histidine kinase [Chryseolinea lacunae]
MRLLQVTLRSSLLYSLVVVLISIPVSIFSVRELLNEEVDEALALHTDQFLNHIQNFSYLDDLETDLEVVDQLSYDVDIKPSNGRAPLKDYQSVSIYDSAEQDFRPFRELSSGVDIKGKHYILTMRMSLVDNNELLVAIGLVQSALIILLATGLLLLNRSLSRKLWEPFYRTLNQLKAYQLDKNEPIRADRTNIIEFDDLNSTVSHLTDRNRKVFLQQKEFIENASHELQTPLAIFQSKLDMLMQKPAITESEAQIIMELEATAQRMSRLNKNLLLLSKIDNEQYNDKEEMELSSVIEGMLTELRPMADVENIIITTTTQHLKIDANKTLIEVLLTNLFHNAIRHNVREGRVMVNLNKRTLTVANTGKAVNMNVEKMFDRFSKESMNKNSTGLGLAIVKRICDTSAYTLHYTFENGMHTFTIVF